MTPDDLSKFLDELEKRLGPTGAHVFELAVRQVYVNAVSSLVMLTIVALIGVAVGPRIHAWATAKVDYSYGEDVENPGRLAVIVIVGIIYAFIAVILLINAFIEVPKVFNPEYAALRDLLPRY